jgi:thiamine kinase-like enzyme
MPPKSPEDSALRWVPGEGPVDLQPLATGLVNESWRVTRAGRCYSLRVATSRAQELGIARAWECRVLAHAAAAGVAPLVHRCEPAAGILVADWVPGRPWTAAETRQPKNVDAMAALLRRVHALPIPEPARRMHPRDWILLYGAALARLPSAHTHATSPPASALLGAAAQAQLARLGDLEPPHPVLCHSDVHRCNVAVGPRLMLLDWEYAHVSEPCWDLAGWIANNDGSEEFASAVLASYAGRHASAAELTRLRLMLWLYDYVCLQWSELFASQASGSAADADTAAGVAARADRLALRLRGAAGGSAG